MGRTPDHWKTFSPRPTGLMARPGTESSNPSPSTGESVLTGAQPRNLPRTPPPMGRRVIEILADSANNRNDSPMETARDEVTAVGITIDRLACSAAAARDGRSAMI